MNFICVDISSKSLANGIKPEALYVKFVSDKIHKNDNPSSHHSIDIIVHFRSRRKEHNSEIPADGMYRSVKPFSRQISTSCRDIIDAEGCI